MKEITKFLCPVCDIVSEIKYSHKVSCPICKSKFEAKKNKSKSHGGVEHGK